MDGLVQRRPSTIDITIYSICNASDNKYNFIFSITIKLSRTFCNQKSLDLNECASIKVLAWITVIYLGHIKFQWCHAPIYRWVYDEKRTEMCQQFISSLAQVQQTLYDDVKGSRCPITRNKCLCYPVLAFCRVSVVYFFYDRRHRTGIDFYWVGHGLLYVIHKCNAFPRTIFLRQLFFIYRSIQIFIWQW